MRTRRVRDRCLHITDELGQRVHSDVLFARSPFRSAPRSGRSLRFRLVPRDEGFPPVGENLCCCFLVTSLRPKGAELQSSRIDFPGYFLMKRFFTHYLEHVGTFRMKYTLPPLVPRRSDCPGCFLSRLPIGTYGEVYTLCLFHFLSLCRSRTISWFLASTTDSETFTVTLDRWPRTLGLLLLYCPHKF